MAHGNNRSLREYPTPAEVLILSANTLYRAVVTESSDATNGLVSSPRGLDGVIATIGASGPSFYKRGSLDIPPGDFKVYPHPVQEIAYRQQFAPGAEALLNLKEMYRNMSGILIQVSMSESLAGTRDLSVPAGFLSQIRDSVSGDKFLGLVEAYGNSLRPNRRTREELNRLRIGCGYEMTGPAALAKTSVLLAQGGVKRAFALYEINLRGEMPSKPLDYQFL